MSLTIRHAVLYTPSVADVAVLDRPGAVQARGGTETVSLVSTVNLSDRPTAVQARGGTETLVIDRFVSDRPGAAGAGRGSAETISLVSTVNVADRAGAVFAGGPSQTLVIDVIRFDRPGAVSGNSVRTTLAGPVTLADSPGAVWAAGVPGQTIYLGDPLAGWPPIVTGPFRAVDEFVKLSAGRVTVSGTTPDATTTSKGKLRLAGDLAGTADAPTVPGKADIAHTHAATVHSHAESDVTSLVSDLAALASSIAGKANASHSHPESDITNLVADLAALTTVLAGKIALSTVTAKGDMIVATGAGAVTKLPVTTNGQSPITDSTQASGWRLATPAAAGSAAQAVLLSSYLGI